VKVEAKADTATSIIVDQRGKRRHARVWHDVDHRHADGSSVVGSCRATRPRGCAWGGKSFTPALLTGKPPKSPTGARRGRARPFL
jgi:hypothetical protein